jgi:large subunit ribosomal protein L32
MSVPVRRQTHGKTRRRRAHHALKKVVLSVCSKCKKAVQPHRACGFCGHYGDKKVLNTARQSERALRRTQAAAEAKPEPAAEAKPKTEKKTEDKKEA